MSTSDLTATTSRGRFASHFSLTGRNRAGLVITFLLGVSNIPSVGMPSGGNGSDGSDGPPFGVLVLGSICGLVMVVGCWLGWRAGNRAAVRIAAGASILAALSAVPAFFVNVPAGIKILVAVSVVVTFVGVVLMLSPERRNSAVVD